MPDDLTSKQHRAIEVANERNEFVTDVDGFVYWWPDGTSHGHHSAEGLRALADELDRRNEKWQAEIDREFGPKPVATVINNNQPGWTCIVETAPNATLDVGTKLYAEPRASAEPSDVRHGPCPCCGTEWTTHPHVPPCPPIPAIREVDAWMKHIDISIAPRLSEPPSGVLVPDAIHVAIEELEAVEREIGVQSKALPMLIKLLPQTKSEQRFGCTMKGCTNTVEIMGRVCASHETSACRQCGPREMAEGKCDCIRPKYQR